MKRSRLMLAFAVTGALAWTVGVTLVGTQADTDPVGPNYDTYNRVLTAAVGLLLLGALAMRSHLHQAEIRPGRRAATALAVGLGLMLVGNVIEFWCSLAAGQVTTAMAEAGYGEEYWGSLPGWLIYLAGEITFLVATLALARAAGRWPGGTTRIRLAIGASGLLLGLSTALWAVSPAAAAASGLLFGTAWLTTALACERVSAVSPAVASPDR